MNIVLLLTGTINPGTMSKTALTNPTKRKKQYIDAIRFWLSNTNLPIVFIENSLTDISNEFINNPQKNRIEFLNFEGNDYDKSIGKGLGEMNCLEYAIKKSLLIRQADFIFKITGRLKVLNFNSYYKHFLQNPVYIMCDLRTNLSFADSRFWACQPEFLTKCLFTYTLDLDDSKGVFFEHILARAVSKALSERHTFSFFPYSLRIQGTSGTSNSSYNSNFLKWHIKNYLKKLYYVLLNR